MGPEPAKNALIAIMVAVSAVSVSAGLYRKDFDLPIPSPHDPQSEYERGWMDDAIIEISDDIIIHDLNLHVALTHQNLIDLQITLQSPAGTIVVLNSWGNIAVLDFKGYRNIVFDDEAQVSIQDAVKGFNGPYRPVEPLWAFDGQSTSGQWALKIYDALYDDSGILHNIEIVNAVPEPATVLLVGFGAVLLRLKRRDSISSSASVEPLTVVHPD